MCLLRLHSIYLADVSLRSLREHVGPINSILACAAATTETDPLLPPNCPQYGPIPTQILPWPIFATTLPVLVGIWKPLACKLGLRPVALLVPKQTRAYTTQPRLILERANNINPAFGLAVCEIPWGQTNWEAEWRRHKHALWHAYGLPRLTHGTRTSHVHW